MAVFEVFSHPEVRRYKAPVLSKAFIFLLICFFITFIVPILISYRSGRFWFKESTYQECPRIQFKHEMLLVVGVRRYLNTTYEDDYVTYSTFHNYNHMQTERLRIPVISSREEDDNGDGRADHLHLSVRVPLLDTEHVHSVHLILFFQYMLMKYSSLHMESLAVVLESHPLPASTLSVIGQLEIEQKQPLGHKGIDTRFNTSLVNVSSTFFADYSVLTMLEMYNRRNVTTRLLPPYTVWTIGRATGDPFVIKVDISYPASQTYTYMPGFWYLIKWGWVQYLACLIPLHYTVGRIRMFVFRNQLITTLAATPPPPVTSNKLL